MKNSFKTPSPVLPTPHDVRCYSVDRENEDLSISDTSSQPSSCQCVRTSVKSRGYSPAGKLCTCGARKCRLTDSAERNFTPQYPDTRWSSRRSSCSSSSPSRKLISPATEGMVYVPKLLTTKYKRSPLETISDSNHQVRQHTVSCSTPATPQNIKHRLLKLL